MLGKLNWFCLTSNTVSVDVKMDGYVLEEKSSFKMLGSTFSSKLDWGSYIISIAKTASKKIGALIHSMKYLSLLLCFFINPPYGQVWTTVVTSGLVPLVATWNCRFVSPLTCCFSWTLGPFRNAASINLFYSYYFGRCTSELTQIVPVPFSHGL